MLIFLAMIDSEDDRMLFTRLYNENHLDMIRYAKAILKDYHAAEDVVHDMFYKMAKDIEKFHPTTCHNPRGLIVTIVKNLCFNKLKRDKIITEIPFEDWASDQTTNPTEMAISYNETHAELIDLIDSIGEDYSAVLKLKILYDYSFETIADFLNITPETARTRASRGYKKLRKIFGKEGDIR